MLWYQMQRIGGHPRKSALSSFLWSQNGRRYTDCTISVMQSTFAPLIIFLHRERTCSSNFLRFVCVVLPFQTIFVLFTTATSTLRYFNKNSTRDSSAADGQSSDPISLHWRTFYLVLPYKQYAMKSQNLRQKQ